MAWDVGPDAFSYELWERAMTGRRRWGQTSLFAAVIGLAGLGNCWSTAAHCLGAPEYIAQGIMLLNMTTWGVLLLPYIGKWIWARPDAVAEVHHPIQCRFVGLIPTATMLIAPAAARYSMPAGLALFIIGAISQFGLAIYLTGMMWMGEHDLRKGIDAVYIRTIVGGCVATTVANFFGAANCALLLFGLGLLPLIVYESVFLRRLLETGTMSDAMRATGCAHGACPYVCCTAYLSITGGPPDIVAQAIFGYGILQNLLLLRLSHWITAKPFSASYWSFSFPMSAAALSALRLVNHGLTGQIEWIAIALFTVANMVIGAIALGTAWLIMRGELMSPPLPQSAPSLAVPAQIGTFELRSTAAG